LIIFDEKKYAEEMLKKGYLTKHKNVFELYVLSKYYFAEGKTKDEVKECVVKFCEKFDEHFNKDEWYKIINKTINTAYNGKLITGREVQITEKEIYCIKSLEKLNEQKVAFVLLVLYKFYGYKKFEISIEDLYRLCKLNLNSKTKLELLQSLTSKELIDITMGSKRWVKFADKKGKPTIIIKDFDEFIYEYLLCVGEDGYSKCETCNKAIKQTNNKKRFCKECARVENIRKTIENRNKNNV
jgi:hypothetical protein